MTGVEDVLVWLSFHGVCSGRESVKTELGAWLERSKSFTKPQKSPAQLVTKLVTKLKGEPNIVAIVVIILCHSFKVG